MKMKRKSSTLVLVSLMAIFSIYANGQTVALSWGSNNWGELGDGTSATPDNGFDNSRNIAGLVFNLTDVIQVAAGSQFSLALKSDGTVWAWGYNDIGQLGIGSTEPKYTPTQVAGLEQITAISCGHSHSMALKSDGTVWAWGNNSNGQLGDGTLENKLVRTQVSISNAVAISCGAGHSLAITSDGRVWAWGDNYYGELGTGDYNNISIPVPVLYLTDIIAISSSALHCLALRIDGTVWAWGYNDSGQLGNGTTDNSPFPIQVLNLSGVDSISAGSTHSLALKSDGTVWACGYPVGDGTTTQRTVPVQVQDLSNIVSISAGGVYSLVIQNNGNVFAWGANDRGQLGDGSYEARLLPVQVPNIFGITSIDAGLEHSIAIYSCLVPTAAVIDNINDDTGCGHFSISFSPGSPVSWQDLYVDGILSKSNVTSPFEFDATDSLSHDYIIRTFLVGNNCYSDSLAYPMATPAKPSKPVITSIEDVDANSLTGIQINYSAGSPASRHDLYMDESLVQTDYATGGLVQPGNNRNHLFTVRAVNGSCFNDSSSKLGRDIVTTALPNLGSAGAWGSNGSGQLGDGTNISNNILAVPQNLSGLSAISAGGAHSLAIKDNGTVWAWGSNSSGQLGNGTNINSNIPVQAINIAGVSAIRCGGSFSLALKSNGSLWAWGSNSSGQLGNGSSATSYIPTAVSNLSGVVDISAGSGHSVALLSDGRVWTWGNNSDGQLGLGDTSNRSIPNIIPVFYEIMAVSGGGLHSLALKSDGTVWAWGYNYYGQLGDGTTTDRSTPVQVLNLTNVIAISAGTFHSLALKSDGTVWAWGYNEYGQLGNGTNDNSSIPIQVSTLDGIVEIAGGELYSHALKSDGTVWAWGANSVGQLGNGTYSNQNIPILSSVNNVSTIACGGEHSLAIFTPQYPSRPLITDISDDICGGITLTYDPGIPASRHSLYVNGSLAQSVVASPLSYYPPDTLSHSYVIRAINLLDAYYNDSDPYLFADGDASPSQPVISAISDINPDEMSGVIITYEPGTPATRNDLYIDGTLFQEDFVSGSTYQPGDTSVHSFMIRAVNPTCSKDSSLFYARDYARVLPIAEGQAVSWGSNSSGQLGDGTKTNRLYPVQVLMLPAVVAISGGSFHSLALKSDGVVWAWGDNGYGQLGDGTTTQRTTPVQVSTLTGVVEIAAGSTHSLALKSDGTVWAWGYNANGQLGDGTTTQRKTPVQVSNLADVVAISSYGMHSIALKSDGTVWAWGYNNYGQLGDGTTTQRTLCVQVLNLNEILSISTGYSHSLAVRRDGTVWSWGYNYYGQLGDGTYTQRTTPVQVSNLTNVVQVSGGSNHSLARKSDGTMWAWGYNNFGQLGDGTTNPKKTPVQVLNISGVVSIDAGESHSLGSKSDGTIWSWGYNGSGQLGDGTTTQRPTCVRTSNLANFTAISAGGNHSLAIFNCGPLTPPVISDVSDSDPCGGLTITFIPGTPAMRHDLYVDAVLVQSGIASPTIYYNPGDSISHSYVIQAFNPSPSCVSDSTPYLFTDSNYYVTQAPVITSALDADGGHLTGVQITFTAGNPSTQHDLYMDGNLVQANYTSGSIYIPGDSNVHSFFVKAINGPCYKDSTSAYAKDFMRAAPSRYGKIACWGDDYYGQLGRGSYYGRTNIPSQVSNIADAASLSSGESHSVALKNDGTVWAWGYNGDGELGNGIYTNSNIPVQTANLTGAVSLSCGAYHTLALILDGSVKSWGYNYYGQLGNGSVINANIPVSVSGITDIVAVAAGGSHSIALRSDGTVWTWGGNNYGQLGDGTTTAKYLPVQVSSLTGIVAIAAGYSHSLALKNDGTVWAWGLNTYGQLGDTSTVTRLTPVQLVNYFGNVAIACGLYHSMSLKSDGTLWTWGFNYYGQIGNGTTTNRTTPGQVTGISQVSAIDGGGYHSIALKSGGTAYTWGYNGDGELGNGTFIQSKVPVSVSTLENAIAINGGSFHSLAIIECVFNTDPSIQNITDNDGCAQSGVTITFTPGTPATSHDLYKDGVLVQSGITSPIIHDPGDANSHNYKVRVIDAATGCYKDSLEVWATDENGTPSQPVLTSIVDNDPGALSGVTVTYTPGSPATQHDLYKDGVLAQPDFTSGTTYLPGDSNLHEYVVRAVNGSCYMNSSAVSGTDQDQVVAVPPEIATGDSSVNAQMWSEDKSTQSWPSEPTATNYKLYRGTLADMPNLLNGNDDSCTRYEGGNTSIDLTSDDPQALPGRLYWYLVTAVNGTGEGSAGNASTCERIINPITTCY